MIKRSQKRPDVFSHQSPDHIYFELHDDKELYGYVALRRRGIYADAHVELERWGAKVLKQIQFDMIQFKAICRDMGIKKVIAQKNMGDTRWPKFIKHLGFAEPEQIQIAYMEI